MLFFDAAPVGGKVLIACLCAGMIGGGGSILATPLLLYVVGLPPHAAIGSTVRVEIRGQGVKAQVIPTPFYKRPKKA